MTGPCGDREIAAVVERLGAAAGRDQGIAVVVDGFQESKLSARGQRQPRLGGHQKLGGELHRRDRVGPGRAPRARGLGRPGRLDGEEPAQRPDRCRRRGS